MISSRLRSTRHLFKGRIIACATSSWDACTHKTSSPSSILNRVFMFGTNPVGDGELADSAGSVQMCLLQVLAGKLYETSVMVIKRFLAAQPREAEGAATASDKMTRVLILGANGQLARNTTRVFPEKTDVALTRLLRQASRLRNPDPVRVKIVEGDVLDTGALRAAMQGQDVVYANLAGDMARPARTTIDAMHAVGLKRLIFVSSMGIYGEVLGEMYRSILAPVPGPRRPKSRNQTWTTPFSGRDGSHTTKRSATDSRRRASPGHAQPAPPPSGSKVILLARMRSPPPPPTVRASPSGCMPFPATA